MAKATRSKGVKGKKGTQVGGPFLATAAICERAIQENDNVFSLVRLFDVVTVHLPPKEIRDKVSAGIALTLFLAFRSGDFIGDAALRIVVSGRKKQDRPTMTLHFEGGQQGPTVVTEMKIGAKIAEQLWIEIYLDGTLMTKLPLKIQIDEPEKATKRSRPKS